MVVEEAVEAAAVVVSLITTCQMTTMGRGEGNVVVVVVTLITTRLWMITMGRGVGDEELVVVVEVVVEEEEGAEEVEGVVVGVVVDEARVEVEVDDIEVRWDSVLDIAFRFQLFFLLIRCI